ncbi:hypothetical protein [Pseudanabaena sp. 'Roaring Creek']|uniref:hypothetical protein n=1 Tax=Pseudanabaena sp. 'Roaring Creek' TaxID=1681830 RepID=UPI0012E148B4|nr:hypothetical protein [Pseudanabaena sp. 'Roaring Creek']
MKKQVFSQTFHHSSLATAANASRRLGKRCSGTWTIPLKKIQVNTIQNFTPAKCAIAQPLGALAQTINILNFVMTAM